MMLMKPIPKYFLAQRLKSKDTKRTACLAHILRNYEAAFKQKPHFAGWYLKILGKIYQIEAALKEGKVDNETQNRYRRRYSLLISARHHGVDPEAYLREVIGRLPGCGSNEAALRELLPENWAAAHKPKQEWLFNQRQAVA